MSILVLSGLPGLRTVEIESYDCSIPNLIRRAISADIILLTDCVFSAQLAPALVGQIKRLSGPKTEIYCCHEIRDEVSAYH